MRSLAALSVVAVAMLVASCADSTVVSTNVVTAIPWSVPEVNHYQIISQRGEVVGTLEKRIEAPSHDVLELSQYFDFPESGFVNHAIVEVNPNTLLPRNTYYRIDGPDGVRTCEADYALGKVNSRHVGEDDEITFDLDIPGVSYDSWADLFLWRTISFTRGWEITYADVVSCTLDRTQLISITLRVEESETITVPAGEFDVWHVEIDSPGGTQDAWFGTDRARTLIRYDNGREVFELLPPQE